MLIRSGDIRDQSPKLSKFAKNFGRLFGPHKFLGAGIVKIVPILSPLPRGASTEKSPVRMLPLARKLLSLTCWILGPVFFSRLINFAGTPIPIGECVGKAWSISSACKNFRAQHPLTAEIQYAKKVHFSGSKLTCNSKPLVDQSSPDFFR